MLSIYLLSLGFGAVMIGVSLLAGGDGDKDADKDFDNDLDNDLDKSFDKSFGQDFDKSFDKDLDKSLDADKHLPIGKVAAEVGEDVLWIPFFSMRFWTFGTASFGLSGVLFTLLWVPAVLGAVVASALGLSIGTGAAWFFRRINKDTVSGDTTLYRFIGEEARVLLPIRPDGQGMIALDTMAGRVEMTATTRDTEMIPVGSRVIIASVREGEASVSLLAIADSEAARRLETLSQREPQ